jgi:hypothetical protein
VLVQAMRLGMIGDLSEAREIVRQSVQVVEYQPQDSGEWDEQWERFARITKMTPIQ